MDHLLFNVTPQVNQDKHLRWTFRSMLYAHGYKCHSDETDVCSLQVAVETVEGLKKAHFGQPVLQLNCRKLQDINSCMILKKTFLKENNFLMIPVFRQDTADRKTQAPFLLLGFDKKDSHSFLSASVLLPFSLCFVKQWSVALIFYTDVSQDVCLKEHKEACLKTATKAFGRH